MSASKDIISANRRTWHAVHGASQSSADIKWLIILMNSVSISSKPLMRSEIASSSCEWEYHQKRHPHLKERGKFVHQNCDPGHVGEQRDD